MNRTQARQVMLAHPKERTPQLIQITPAEKRKCDQQAMEFTQALKSKFEASMAHKNLNTSGGLAEHTSKQQLSLVNNPSLQDSVSVASNEVPANSSLSICVRGKNCDLVFVVDPVTLKAAPAELLRHQEKTPATETQNSSRPPGSHKTIKVKRVITLDGNIEEQQLDEPELEALDLAAPELAVPELAAPELAAPELAAPDLAVPEPLGAEYPLLGVFKRSFRCKVCNYNAKQHDLLKLHMRMLHSEQGPFECSQCLFTTLSQEQFMIHLKEHRTHKQLTCSECGFQTTTACALKAHAMTHTSSLPYKCDQCTFTTLFKRNFEQHMWTHCRKLFQCAYCKFSSLSGQELLKHVKKKH